MKTKHLIFLAVFMIGFAQLQAQLTSDALRYTQLRSNGTARASGLSGSIGGVGADFAAIGINPAGLGMYRKSDFNFSFQAQNTNIKSLIDGDGSNLMHSQNSLSAQLGGVGLVITSKPIGSQWKQLNFALGLNATGSFNEKFYFSGVSAGSILHRYIEISRDPNYNDGRGYHPDELDAFEAGLAYETGALYDLNIDSNLFYYTTDIFDKKNVRTLKSENFRQNGTAQNITFGISGNYDEKLLIGANVEIPVGEYSLYRNYVETNPNNSALRPFDQIQTQENVRTDYGGVMVKLGAIFKPVHALRIGLSWHSPTLLWMSDQFNTEMEYKFIDNGSLISYDAYSPDGFFNYRLTTPMRWIGSAAIVGRMGFINFDVDFYDPSDARFDLTAESNNETDRLYQVFLNNDIQKQYKRITEYRLGGELALDQLRIRGGYELSSSPFANSDEFSQGFSIGIGLRLKRFYWDISYAQGTQNLGYVPFRTNDSDFDGDGKADAIQTLVSQDWTRRNMQMTFGFKF